MKVLMDPLMTAARTRLLLSNQPIPKPKTTSTMRMMKTITVYWLSLMWLVFLLSWDMLGEGFEREAISIGSFLLSQLSLPKLLTMIQMENP